ncbi:MAG: hypothetical protein QOF69_1069 [Solirubrobacteraceae bacterium]|nr:hypothetical protein [Solirubrobacteraceae bacterium]
MGGFSIQMTAHALSLLDSYIYGFALQEISLPFDSADEVADVAARIFEQFPADRYPYLAEPTVEHALKPGYDYGDEFDIGLDLIPATLDRLSQTT